MDFLKKNNYFYIVIENINKPKTIIMRQLSLTIFALFGMCLYSLAQNRQVTGTITTKNNESLISATVKLKGAKTTTTTNADGVFSMSVPAGNVTLVVTSVGFVEQEIAVGAAENNIKITMAETQGNLSEVVVTAFGVRRDKKILTSSVTQIDGSAFTESRTANIGNALAGKVAGVNISQPGTGAAGSTRISIRGGSSLNGADQPLYVINGVPMESGNQGSAGLWGGNDAGDGLSAINPDDIESISVLKGNTASALYGSKAGNGVILITTKSGKNRKGMGVSFNSNITTDNVVDRRDFQTEYGPGTDGLKPLNQNDALNTGSNHWGPKLDNSQVVQFDGVSRPYSNVGTNLSDFYRRGLTANNSLALSGGNESGNYRFALADLDVKDLMPNASFKRQTINFNINSKLKKITLSASGQYSKQKAKNRPRLSDSPGNANFSLFMMPNTLPLDVIKGTTGKLGALPDGNELRYQGNTFVTNPYWGANQFFRADKTDRFLGNISLRYDVTNWLYVQGRVGTDYAVRDDASYTGYGTAFKPKGDYFETLTTTRQDNLDIFIGANKKFGNFSGDILLGGTKNIASVKSKGGGGNDLVVPFVHSVRNVAASSFNYGFREVGTNSIFGSANVGYKNYLFLNLTGRQDQYSTLSPENNTLFYPSVGMSFIASDAFKLPTLISFAKVRAAWAQVGAGAPDPYALLLSYGLVGNQHLGANLGQIANGTIPNKDLKPLTSTEFEIGADIRFLKNRFGLDIAYYNRKTTDDILPTNISATSGFGSTLVNVGEVENKGIELLLSAKIIDKKDIKWEMSFNYAKNESKAVNLGNDATGKAIEIFNQEESRVRRERVRNVLGQPLGLIAGYKHKTTDKGVKIYTPEGYPVATAGYETIAEGRHPISGGLTNSLSYKNFKFEFLIDFRKGGHVISGTNYFAYTWGLQKETLAGRNGDLRVVGALDNGTPLDVTIPVANIDNYWARYAQISENLVYDASFGRLRQLVIGYTIPAKVLGKTPFESLSVSLVGRNLALLWSKTPNIDPESSYSVNTGAQGLEFFAMPQTKSFGINISANF